MAWPVYMTGSGKHLVVDNNRGQLLGLLFYCDFRKVACYR